IYNFRAVRDRLEKKGHSLKTQGDTEVLAHLAEDCEPIDVAAHLDGMFAFAIWDDARRRLVLGRDRFGKKPLFYYAGERCLVFGSEIKAVLAHPSVPRSLNTEAIPAYLAFGYVPTPGTFFAGIRSLPPGCVLTFDRDGALSVQSYWSLETLPQRSPLDRFTPDEAAGKVRTGLRAAVEKRLVADVPVGAFLSGGIDSSAVVATMADLVTGPVPTFTIGFEDEDGFDERPYARLVANRFGTDHMEFVVKPNAIDLVERLVWHHDQPFGDSSAIPTFLLSELTRGHVTVALCGDGGDEVFAGYERFAGALALRQYRRIPQSLRKGINTAVKQVPDALWHQRGRTIKRFVAQSERDPVDAFREWVSYVPEDLREALLPSASGWGSEDYRRVWGRFAEAPVLDRLQLLTIATYLLDDLLPKVDRMSMAHGLEVRSPLLDPHLAGLAFALPPRARIRGLSGKWILKRAMAGILPAEILHRRKRGFGVPLDRWFRRDLHSYVRSTLGSPTARIRAHVNGEALDRVLQEHASGSRNHGQALWTLLTLEIFLARGDFS
ncbi:MAG TPA: asparagine synthase (glutamine-hydrolyzing), partial [Actinomycetota bacterium]|nr:asparagine synthase (glutamine-hydrolyzing) [Actinomycetota bacterium]